MFENVLGQPATAQLSGDIQAGGLAPSLLFTGPPASGKGTAGLELGRALSCENPLVPAPWNCGCSACAQHRLLSHPDLLILGPRSFSAETAAAAAAFLREPAAPQGRLLFIRSVRKLLVRFNPLLWEEDPKIGKLSPLIAALDEDLDELIRRHMAGTPPEAGPAEQGVLKKISDSILKNVLKLEAEGIGDLIPVAHIRRASYWSRLAPLGKRKLLFIENADRMQDGARNALLKILEEPPDSVHILLCSAHREALIPTILSRLRPYRFYQREAAAEEALIRRVFREEGTAAGGPGASPLAAYFDSFLPVPAERLYPLAAFFAASLALQTIYLLRKRGLGSPPPELSALGKEAAPLAEAAGLGRPLGDSRLYLAKVLEGAEQFAGPGLFTRFLRLLLSLVSQSLKNRPASDGPPAPAGIGYAGIWQRLAGEAETAVGIYNQSPALALERLGTEFRRAAAEYYGG
jgi:DNA polymerase-3 subunit gamma/tau